MRKHQNSSASAAYQLFDQGTKILEQWQSGRNLAKLLRQYEQRSLLTNLIYNAFRHLAVIDWIIDACVKGGLEVQLRNTLRISLGDILYMHGLPEEVVCDVAVRYTKSRHSRQKANFINGVLRRIIRQGAENWRLTALAEGEPYVKFELSPELYRQWHKRDNEEIAYLSELLKSPAPLTVRARGSVSPAEVNTFLKEIPSPSWASAEQFFECSDARALFKSELFKQNRFYVQDPSTLLAPSLVNPGGDENIADLCCAPGGKALILAEQMEDRGVLLCMDRSSTRLSTAASHLSKFTHTLIVLGSVEHAPVRKEALDALLLDVPCSNTGVIRRRPDVRWRFSQGNLHELMKKQAELLDKSAGLVKAGGRLVYSTCSIEEEENQAQIKEFLLQHPEFQKIEEKLLVPDRHHDGAYAALLKKRR